MERSSFSSRKRQKKVKDAEQNSDRLSGLPDDVLCHILSFLPTKKSVGTSILSKRWMSLWAHVPVFEFELVHPDVITSVMCLPEAPRNLNTFRLCNVKCSESILRTWITTALWRNVQKINLFFGIEDRFYTLPQRLFTCKTLVELDLGYCKCIPSSCHVSLPSLKKLCLHSVEYEDDEALPHLLSGCPVLEELKLSNTRLSSDYDHKDFVCEKIFSSTVKTLKVYFHCGCPENPDCRIIINTPSLRYIDVEHCCLSCLTILPNTMTSLIEADLELVADVGYSDNAVNFLNSLCKVKCLKIKNEVDYEPLDLTFGGSVVKFENLTKLELHSSLDWHDLVKFLGLANNLEELEVYSNERIYVEPKQEPTCLLSCLKTIRIHSLESDIEDFNMVRYFLRNAQVLEMMELWVNFDKEKLEELERISLFERGSRVDLIIH